MSSYQKHWKAGCYDCSGEQPKWTAANAKGVAAKHRDTAGHTTWVVETTIYQGNEKEKLEKLGQGTLLK